MIELASSNRIESTTSASEPGAQAAAHNTRLSTKVLADSVVIPVVVTMGILLVVYGLTMAPDLSWANYSQDGGELITAAVTMGVPHPPGYPTYVLVGKLFSLVPLGTVAFRFNLLSAVMIAGAGGLLAGLVALRKTEGAPALTLAIAAGLTMGFLPPIWSQATITEVYGLNLAFIAAFVFCLIGRQRPLLSGLFLGLAITSHLSSLLMVPMALLLVPQKQFGRLGVGLLCGLLPLGLVALFSQGGSPVIWGSGQTLKDWWWLVSGQLYKANLHLPATGVELQPSLLRPAMRWGLILVVGGVVLPLLAGTHLQPQSRRENTVLGLTATSFGLFALLYQTADAFVLLLPGLLIGAYLVFTRFRWVWWAALLVPLVLLVTGFKEQDLRQDQAVRPMVEAVFAAAPEHAILLTPGDRTIFTLWYFQHVEHQRNDLLLIDTNLLAFDWYRARLQERWPSLQGLAADDLDGFLRANLRQPQCWAGLVSKSAESNHDGYTSLLGSGSTAPYLSCRVATP